MIQPARQPARPPTHPSCSRPWSLPITACTHFGILCGAIPTMLYVLYMYVQYSTYILCTVLYCVQTENDKPAACVPWSPRWWRRARLRLPSPSVPARPAALHFLSCPASPSLGHHHPSVLALHRNAPHRTAPLTQDRCRTPFDRRRPSVPKLNCAREPPLVVSSSLRRCRHARTHPPRSAPGAGAGAGTRARRRDRISLSALDLSARLRRPPCAVLRFCARGDRRPTDARERRR